MNGRFNSQTIDDIVTRIRAHDFSYTYVVQELMKIGINQHEAEEVADTAIGLKNEEAEDYVRKFLEAV
ncbi:MAG TPA: hypothetical protein VHT73_18990 [Thermodesulfobacteriota bacterium]|nr:hypothetical protein [Thermodesulfobacteriota bacterium]